MAAVHDYRNSDKLWCCGTDASSLSVSFRGAAKAESIALGPRLWIPGRPRARMDGAALARLLVVDVGEVNAAAEFVRHRVDHDQRGPWLPDGEGLHGASPCCPVTFSEMGTFT